MAKSPCQFLRVLYKIQKGVHYINIPSGSCKRIRLGFVDKEELERMRIARLGDTRNRICHRFQAVIQRRGVDDFDLASQFLVDCLSKFSFLVGNRFRAGRLSQARDRKYSQQRHNA
jgi:hypothetical protein